MNNNDAANSAIPSHFTGRRIVVCADDFGLTEAASQSIIALAKNGAISATSCVVDGAYTQQYASALLQVNQACSVGLHLNLTENPSASMNAGLNTWLLRSFVLRGLETKTNNSDALNQEITRQLDKFEALFGHAPHYVDGHEHVHQFPGVREALLQVLQARYATCVAVRSTVPMCARGAKASIIAMLGGRKMQKKLTQAQMKFNTDFAGVYDFSTRVPFESRMSAWLKTLIDGGLVMCHPEAPIPGGTQQGARENEHEFLLSPRWQKMRHAFDIRLESFHGLFSHAI